MARPSQASRITLVRHGRPAPVALGPAPADAIGGPAFGRVLDAAEFARWCDGYARVGLAPDAAAPGRLGALVAAGARVVASDLPRAFASAALLAPGAQVRTSPLLREVEPLRPPWPGVRLPLAAWLVVARAGWGAGAAWAGGESRAAAVVRAETAARWLSDLGPRDGASRDGAVVALTHGAVRPLIAAALVRAGWRGRAWGPVGYWSAWTLTAPPAGERADGDAPP